MDGSATPLVRTYLDLIFHSTNSCRFTESPRSSVSSVRWNTKA